MTRSEGAVCFRLVWVLKGGLRGGCKAGCPCYGYGVLCTVGNGQNPSGSHPARGPEEPTFRWCPKDRGVAVSSVGLRRWNRKIPDQIK